MDSEWIFKTRRLHFEFFLVDSSNKESNFKHERKVISKKSSVIVVAVRVSPSSPINPSDCCGMAVQGEFSFVVIFLREPGPGKFDQHEPGKSLSQLRNGCMA